MRAGNVHQAESPRCRTVPCLKRTPVSGLIESRRPGSSAFTR